MDEFSAVDWTKSRVVRQGLTEVSSFAEDAQLGCPIVHIAGTNGKGSLAWNLTQSLPRCGSFTSPFLEHVCECVAVAGQPISRHAMLRLLRDVQRDEKAKGVELTPFERLTVVALRYFREQKVQFAVIECGMGGRLDSTNIVHGDVCVLTSVGLEHTAVLGDTVEAIAKEKAGIFKRGSHVLCGPDTPPLEHLAQDAGARSFECLDRREETYDATALRLAKAVLELLGADPTEASFAAPPCRFEVLETSKARFVLDVAHNPHAINALVERSRSRFPSARLAVVCSMARDKDIAEMLRLLRCLTPDVTKCAGNDERTCPEGAPLAPTLRAAAGRADVVLVCGTFAMMREARQVIVEMQKDSIAYVAIGSNIGDRAFLLSSAVQSLRALEGVEVLQTSSLYTTAPKYVTDQPSFLNAIVEVKLATTRLNNLPGLIVDLKGIESDLGRVPSIRNGPRAVDLDIIAVGQTVCSSEGQYPLRIPHERMHERDFVLVPMAEIRPDWAHPARDNQTVRSMLDSLALDGREAPFRVIPASGGLNGRAGGPVFQQGKQTLVMGIVNVTPDSFSDGGDHFQVQSAVEAAMAMIKSGAQILDIGGESTRPGAAEVPVDEEIRRVVPVIRAIREKVLDVTISVDTRNSSTAKAAVQAGADWINDVSGGLHDAEMLSTAAHLSTPVVLMHMRGNPKTMRSLASYTDVVDEVTQHLIARRDAAIEAGIPRWNVILDPGIGFAKNMEHNLLLLHHCRKLVDSLHPSPVLIGASRKRFLGDILDEPDAKGRLFGSLAAAAAAAQGLSEVLRVHDVAETVQLVKVCDRIYRQPVSSL